jgi:uncharacterized protein (TIGR03083 family)
MEPVQPILTAPLFPGLHRELMALVRGLSPSDWEKPTRAGSWRVRDVAAHLVDSALRKLTFQRDGVPPPPPPAPITDAASLLAYLDALNAEWVSAARRIGPRLLADLLELTGRQLAEFVASLDPDAEALFPVAWAGEDVSRNWMDIGREYTERWHHEQQIREAVGVPLLLQREWLFPVLDISMRALPHAYREVAAEAGAAVVVHVTGAAGGSWSLRRESRGWTLFAGDAGQALCRVTADADTTWRVFFKAIAPAAAAARVSIDGDSRLGRVFLGTLAVMARR